MSTIEKAVGKLGQNGDPEEKIEAPVPPVVGAVEKAASIGEGAAADKAAPASPSHPTSIGKAPIELPLAEFDNKGMVTPFTPRSRVAEEFRTIKRPLLRNTEIEGADVANLIMVTSALMGDGKTFTALNLAISIAMEEDRTVLFVDADVATAQAGKLLGISKDSPGLIDVLENKGISLADAILPTSIDNLRILPAGNGHERSTELLASQSMRRLMEELSGRYPDRVIVFDSPALLLTSEASVLASFMGQIAFVVSTDQTSQEAITRALEHIGDDKIIGMVLNKAHSRRSKLFGLGYGYGYGSSDRPTDAGNAN